MTTTNLPSDDVGAALERIDGTRGQRYGEIILLGAGAAHGYQVGGVYTTTGLNDPTRAGDSCPQELWDRIDPAALAEEHGALGALKNGPRRWCLDWVEAMIGAERDFAGLKARWAAWLDITDPVHRPGSAAYTPLTSRRNTRLGLDRGSTAYVLDDPDRNPWVLKSVDLRTLPDEDPAGLGDRLDLPTGWAFRVVTLDADLVLTSDGGWVPIIQDELGNAYDRAGGAFSSHRPQEGRTRRTRAPATRSGATSTSAPDTAEPQSPPCAPYRNDGPTTWNAPGRRRARGSVDGPRTSGNSSTSGDAPPGTIGAPPAKDRPRSG